MMEDNTISIDQFLQIANVKLKTVIKNRDKIPGLSYINGKFNIIKGTRYPGAVNRFSIKNSYDKRYVLLKMISQNKYIDHIMLHLYEDQFKVMLSELLEVGLIKNNHLFNKYGANNYDCTTKGEQLLRERKLKVIKELSNIIASTVGHFCGTMISNLQ